MRLAILSRNKDLHSIRRLLQEAKRRGVTCDIINPLDCQLVLQNDESRIIARISGQTGYQALPRYDAVLPRIGASITAYGLSVVRQFEALGSQCINSARAIEDSRDKLRCLQILSETNLPIPNTVLLRHQRGLREHIPTLGGMPVVLKLLEGTQGLGVMIVHSQASLSSVLDTLWGLERNVLLQQFIADNAGRDVRAFVVGNEVIGTMERTAPAGEFRANIHRGGHGRPVSLPKKWSQIVIQAAKVLGLQVAGVDFMVSARGPMILEVNSSPGFEGIELATGKNIAGKIIDWMIKQARKNARLKRRPKQRKRSR